ncbi:MFS transporter [Bimuria novae-zelandiae CBS 107.79]|uniref:MFS transporter n=1 Tax=Bimuria novae-zelandiae CBS 107.79 TaxID=1447943 RepID=A0A6A5V9B1_9PLEO|nr:MFS transporter [Bimuria novae-zelandiae CBS 107.79]
MKRYEDEQETVTLLGDSSPAEEPDLRLDDSPAAPEQDSCEVIEFGRIHNLSHKIHIFHRAALLVQGIPVYDIPSFTEDETRAVRAESESKWRQPLRLYLIIVVTVLGAMEQGWVQTSMNGVNLYLPKAFSIDADTPRNDLILGVINSGIYLSNGLLSAWLVTPLNKRLGRRGAVFSAALCSLFSNIGGALTQNWQQLLLFRLILGCALGVISSTLNVFAAECVPAAIRGGLAVSWQMFCAFSIFVGFVANVAVYAFGPKNWRLRLAGPFLSTILLLGLIYVCPESLAWHLKHGGRYNLAYRSLVRLRNTELQAAGDPYLVYLQRPAKANMDVSYLKHTTELFIVPRIRRATLAVYTVMISQQLCGINIISFYSSTIFADANFSTFGALVASTVFGFVNFIALTILAAGLSFSVSNENPARLWLLATMIYLFCVEHSPGMGPVPAAYSAEVFPLSHREIGVSSAVAVTNIWAAALSLTFPALVSTLSSQGASILYALLNVVALCLVFLFVPETRLKRFDELDEVFSVPTRQFVKYQVTEYLP